MMDSIEQNKQTLERANAAIAVGDYEGFLCYCTEDTRWTFVGEQTLKGKDAVRGYMAETYIEPPRFAVELLTGEGDVVTAVGKISLKGRDGEMVSYSYCDVWRLRDGKLHELKAFVIQNMDGVPAYEI
ncbi:nuclear transport factor 2 family protein [Pedobacter africanus]|uniref:Ketosteroid isomerase-related protein n=1 Tax=Pedobacter africanus TaxID=151894 RepID=A0A1W2CR77_9SPHI|nr:nuclear transport factor 2 family protein [Pedobacter africanus]SMC87703.1 Ketosteroid isomerase-related protein [Pedobacter africanus]